MIDKDYARQVVLQKFQKEPSLLPFNMSYNETNYDDFNKLMYGTGGAIVGAKLLNCFVGKADISISTLSLNLVRAQVILGVNPNLEIISISDSTIIKTISFLKPAGTVNNGIEGQTADSIISGIQLSKVGGATIGINFSGYLAKMF